jgi:hypothetical protein
MVVHITELGAFHLRGFLFCTKKTAAAFSPLVEIVARIIMESLLSHSINVDTSSALVSHM